VKASVPSHSVRTAEGREVTGHRLPVNAVRRSAGQPAPGAGPFLFRDLVDAVDQQESAPCREHPVRPAGRLGAGERAAHRAQEVVGDGESGAAPGESAQREDERQPAHQVGELTGEPFLAGGREGRPLDECGLA
jgi:hypothetical protein